jgi:S1-C subfamily serine protease
MRKPSLVHSGPRRAVLWVPHLSKLCSHELSCGQCQGDRRTNERGVMTLVVTSCGRHRPRRPPFQQTKLVSNLESHFTLSGDWHIAKMPVLGRPCSSTSVVSTMPPGARHLTSLRCATCVAMILLGVNVGRAVDISAGSGVVIGTHGEVLTNAHVVENCTEITVRSSSASVIARDEKNDLCYLKAEI